MNNPIFQYAQWICPAEFSSVLPRDVLQMQKSGDPIDTPPSFQNRHFLVRRRFRLQQAGTAILRITADDYYKLSINGKTVGQGPAQGYHDRYYWNEYDITAHLADGENEITVDLYYHGLICRAYNSGDNRISMAAELLINNNCVLCTDESWECAEFSAYDRAAGVIGYDTQFKENFDNRRGFVFEPCAVIDADYTFAPAPTASVTRYYKTPKIMKTLEDGSVFCDFGEEITAMPEITAFGEDGDTVEILCGEEADGTSVRSQMRCSCDYDELLTLRQGINIREQYDYKGFRYVRLIPSGDAKILALKAVVRHYPFDDNHCVLQTENKLLSSIFDLCKASVKYGAQEVFVDCPTREKGQYAGDLLITGSAHLILTGDDSLLKKAIDDQMQSVGYSETLLAVTPGSYWQEIADYSLLFPLLAWRYYVFSGDRDYLKQNFDVCKRLIGGFRMYEREDGLLRHVSDKWNLVDWPANLRDGYDFTLEPPDKLPQEPHNVINAFYIGCVLCVERIAAELGEDFPTAVKS